MNDLNQPQNSQSSFGTMKNGTKIGPRRPQTALAMSPNAMTAREIAFGLIASAVCGLLGPIFVPFFIVPKLDWLFWGWFKSFIQYSFVPVVAIAFLMIFEQFVFRYVTTLPPTITSAEYGIYGLQAVAVIATFCIGMTLVPSLTNSIFSGSSGESVLHHVRIGRFMGR